MIEVAKGAGFCFGVNRAVEKVEFLLKQGFKVCTLGDLIHNGPFCESLRQKGVRVVDNVCGAKLKSDEYLVIRSHGVGPNVYKACIRRKIKFIDATCPFVKRIHKIVNLKSRQGRTILIAGDEHHPEVCAIKKYCSGFVFVFSKFEELWSFLKDRSGSVALVAQTTFNSFVWKKGVERLKSLNFGGFKSLEIFNTICHVTENRQIEAVNLAKRVDFMVVIGGRNSSNSKKLFELCSNFCRTLFVETIQELEFFLRTSRLPDRVGICAGASTPPEVIASIYELIKIGVK